MHIPASNVIEGDEHLQHSAPARFGDCGWHCNGHRCHCSGDLRAWSGNLDDDLGRLSRLFRSAARAVLQPARGDLRYNDAEPSAPGYVRLTVGVPINHPSVASPAQGTAVIPLWPLSAGHSCRSNERGPVLSRSALACLLMKNSFTLFERGLNRGPHQAGLSRAPMRVVASIPSQPECSRLPPRDFGLLTARRRAAVRTQACNLLVPGLFAMTASISVLRRSKRSKSSLSPGPAHARATVYIGSSPRLGGDHG